MNLDENGRAASTQRTEPFFDPHADPVTEKAVRLMSGEAWDEDLLEDLSGVMADASICGLGQAAPNPLRCVIKYFREDQK